MKMLSLDLFYYALSRDNGLVQCSHLITQWCNRQRGESSFAVVFVGACVLFTALIIIFSPQIANLGLNPQSQISKFLRYASPQIS
jgi:hypothetical protein